MPSAALSPGGRRSAVASAALESAAEVPGLGTQVEATLEWCVQIGLTAPLVGGGATADLWELLAGIAALDVSAARILEPHLDALAILRESGTDLSAGRDPWSLAEVGARADSTWGVYAAESAGARLVATASGGGWRLSGTKPWCSLASQVSHALVTAFVDDTHRRLFAVDMRAAGVHPHRDEWFARGLSDVVSSAVDFDDVAAAPVGDVGWYLSRPGFARGGMSVAACWWGAAVGVAQALVAPAASERADQLALVHLGRVDAALWAARAALAEAAGLIDEPQRTDRVDEKLLADRVRTIIVDAANLALAEADAALGPAPLVSDLAHARRVADLHLYLRQHHGLRDVAKIGRGVAGVGA